MTYQAEETKKQIKIMRENLKSLRKERGWTVEELSEISGIDIKTLNGMEREQDFDIQYLFDLCRIYHIQPPKIFCQKF